MNGASVILIAVITAIVSFMSGLGAQASQMDRVITERCENVGLLIVNNLVIECRVRGPIKKGTQ